VGIAFEEFVDGFAEGAGAFAVNDADSSDAKFKTLFDVVGDKVAEFVGAEGVEIEFPIDGDFDGIFLRHGELNDFGEFDTAFVEGDADDDAVEVGVLFRQ